MKTKHYNLLVLMLMLIIVSVTAPVQADSAKDRECQIKAAFVYNFIKFIDWPEEKISPDSKSITIGVIGADDFIKAFDPVKNKQVKGKDIVIKPLEELDKLNDLRKKNISRWKEKIKEIRKYQVLFICACQDKKEEIPVELLKALENSGVLVVGEIPGFLENGGAINFVMENKRVRFEINTKVANCNGLKIRSQLLKLAKRVIKEKKAKVVKG